MRNPFLPAVGGVLSADIAVPEHESELAFYTSVLTTGDKPLWQNDLMNNLGEPVIGLGARTPEYDALPLQWMPHFQVADIATSVAQARKLGGKELLLSLDDSNCQWAVLTDPDGAAFGLIPTVTSEPDSVQQDENVGRISWLSLVSSNAESSQDFYQRVVGWKTRPITADIAAHKNGFEMLLDEQTAAAEIRQRGSEEKDIPSVWLIHLTVKDIAESLRRVRDGGGTVISEFDKAAGAVIRDPVGVCLALQGQQ